jgi:ribosome-binding protein aMBF1 (putative translation factor)
MYSHQDWTPVILKKKPEQQKVVVQKHVKEAASVSATSNKPMWKIEQQVDSDVGKPIIYVSKDLSKKILAARVAAKLSQKDLAQKLNMQMKDVQDIESGKAIENKLILGKIKRCLNITD